MNEDATQTPKSLAVAFKRFCLYTCPFGYLCLQTCLPNPSNFIKTVHVKKVCLEELKTLNISPKKKFKEIQPPFTARSDPNRSSSAQSI